ncbi:hypothetical protein G7046_g7366 [Stylonectria norvegica]|nr:hypothetical protein G7046_g7366 [Stylonectria norvegica]
MMHPLFGLQPADSLPVTYSQDAIFDDLSTQMAISQASRRLSQRSNGQRSGNAMRVVKPSSANNSPRSALLARRMTFMNDDNNQYERQQAPDQTSMYYASEFNQPTKRASRPLSWHPSSYGQQLQPNYQYRSYQSSTPNMYADQQDMYTSYPHISPMMASYSCNTSPSSSFSPLSLPLQSADNVQYLSSEENGMARQSSVFPSLNTNQFVPDAFSTPDEYAMSSTNGLDWNTFIMHGYSSTSPPTPEAYPQTQLPQPAMPNEAICYRALEEPEEEGEILIGMGLYDTPEKCQDDPQLNNYRSTVSSLLGSTFRGHEPEGKGLKLEETWEPPKSEDEDEEDDDQDSSED